MRYITFTHTITLRRARLRVSYSITNSIYGYFQYIRLNELFLKHFPQNIVNQIKFSYDTNFCHWQLMGFLLVTWFIMCKTIMMYCSSDCVTYSQLIQWYEPGMYLFPYILSEGINQWFLQKSLIFGVKLHRCYPIIINLHTYTMHR